MPYMLFSEFHTNFSLFWLATISVFQYPDYDHITPQYRAHVVAYKD